MLTGAEIHGFTSAVLMKNFDNPVETPNFHHELWDLMCLPDPKVAVAAPRGHAKSTAVTHAYTLAHVLFRENDHVLLVSDTEEQAKAFLGDIKNELLENDELRDLFGVDRLLKDRETECVGRFNDGTLFRLVAKGSEQKLRGLKWRNKRPNLIVCDDLENDEIVMNDERRAKFRQWFFNALVPCGSRHAKIRVVGTILHMDALLERLMPPANHENTVVEPLKDWYNGDDRVWTSIRFRAHDKEFENILWEDHLNEKALRLIRQDYIDQGMPEGYSQEYLNYPIDEENSYFRREDFHDLDEDTIDLPMEYYVACDLAISEKKKAAYTVFCVAGVDANHTLKYVDVRRFRGDALEIIEVMFDIHLEFSPECFFVEQENIARTLGPVLNREMEERNMFLNIEPMTASQDKLKRARGLQARMRAGAVEFDHQAEWYPDFLTEMLQFPRGAYKDQVDAASWIPIGLDKIREAPTRAELEDEYYEQEYEESYDSFSFGASNITGY